MLPRVHGSAVFQRGETQALITVTLGTGRDEQRVDGLIDEYSQEVHARLQLPVVLGRRSAGRSADRAAAKSATACWPSGASSPVLPDPEEFPYTIRVISRHSGIERFQLDGQRVRRDAGSDGRRRADHAIPWRASRSAW